MRRVPVGAWESEIFEWLGTCLPRLPEVRLLQTPAADAVATSAFAWGLFMRSGLVRLFWIALFTAGMFSASVANAATQIIDTNGKLIGATDVNVNGTFYDVSFVDGSCVSAFDGCDEQSDFDFSSISQAESAAQALLDQVLIDGTLGAFDSDPTKTFGCSYSDDCVILVPWSADDDLVFSRFALNYSSAISSTYGVADHTGGEASNKSTSLSTDAVFARFALVSDVPEPSTWLLMLIGSGAVGVAMRRSQRQHTAALA